GPQASTVPATDATVRPTAKFPCGNVRNDNRGVTNASRRPSYRCLFRDSPRSPRRPCSADKSCSIPGTPFFPLVNSGLNGVSSDLVRSLTDFEFGGTQKLAIGFGGHDPRHIERFLLGFLADDRRHPLCLSFLFGRELEVHHWYILRKKDGEFPKRNHSWL